MDKNRWLKRQLKNFIHAYFQAMFNINLKKSIGFVVPSFHSFLLPLTATFLINSYLSLNQCCRGRDMDLSIYVLQYPSIGAPINN